MSVLDHTGISERYQRISAVLCSYTLTLPIDDEDIDTVLAELQATVPDCTVTMRRDVCACWHHEQGVRVVVTREGRGFYSGFMFAS